MAKHLEKERKYTMRRPRSLSFDDRRLRTEHSAYWSDSDLEIPHTKPQLDQGSWTSSSSYYTAVIPDTHAHTHPASHSHTAPHTHPVTHRSTHHTGYLFPGHGTDLG